MDYSFLNLRLISDLKPDRGAFGGLYTAIASATHPTVAVVACDMPFASAKLIEGMSRLIVQHEADVVITKSEHGYEPLHAVYRRETCLPAIESAIDADKWKVIAWFPQVKVHVLTAEEINPSDPDGLAFWNVNTPEEFAEAERDRYTHNQHRAGRVTDDLLACASQQQPSQPSQTARTHDDHIAFARLCHFDDGFRRVSFDQFGVDHQSGTSPTSCRRLFAGSPAHLSNGH